LITNTLTYSYSFAWYFNPPINIINLYKYFCIKINFIHYYTKIIGLLLRNRRFYVSLQNNKNRWRRQNNGLPHGSVLVPIIFNIRVYTNDKPIGNQTKHFIYTDDLAITTQGKSFEEVEKNLNATLTLWRNITITTISNRTQQKYK